MPRRHAELDDNDEIMRRCRQVRDERDRRFKTVDALCDHIGRLEREARARRTRTDRAPCRTETPCRLPRGQPRALTSSAQATVRERVKDGNARAKA